MLHGLCCLVMCCHGVSCPAGSHGQLTLLPLAQVVILFAYKSLDILFLFCCESVAVGRHGIVCVAVQGPMGSYASAAERQSSFTSQTSSQPNSFCDPLTGSRPESFVSASASSFPASRLNSVTAGSRPDAPHTAIEMPNSGQAQLQTSDAGNGVLSATPPSQQQGWR